MTPNLLDAIKNKIRLWLFIPERVVRDKGSTS